MQGPGCWWRFMSRSIRCMEVAALISEAIMDDPPVSTKEGWFIRDGYHAGLDEIRRMLTHTKEYLAQTEAAERERTGIKNLRIGFNKVFGYYIEITNSYKELVPKEYIRKPDPGQL